MPTNASVPLLTNENTTKLLDLIKQLQTNYAGTNLTISERRKLTGLKERNKAFVSQVQTELKINPSVVHPSVKLADFNANITAHDNLLTVIDALLSYIEALKDSELFLANQIMDQAGLVTDYIKTISKGNQVLTESYKRISDLRKKKNIKNQSKTISNQ